MKNNIEAGIMLMSFCAVGAIHMAAIPAAIVWHFTNSNNLALLILLGSFIPSLLLLWLVFVKLVAWTASKLDVNAQKPQQKDQGQTSGFWTKVFSMGRRLPEVEQRINGERDGGVGGAGA